MATNDVRVTLVKIWLHFDISRATKLLWQNKIGLVFGFCGLHLIAIGLVSVCDFPENDISKSAICFYVRPPAVTKIVFEK